ncbi:MAG: YggT family protein [Alphaproteobacteria bacterium]|nr:YggT family protein [Alphaproteobacteria bacterium]MBV9371889.1 YggT family protein [Alphaproteobacteria bacterium]MBV9902275.1 YggT family protein [Alphaproteobacteria bacterium]
MLTLLDLLGIVLWIFSWVIIIQVILGWLVAFNVVNSHSPFVRGLIGGLEKLTDPFYRPIRKILPDFGGLDLSPMVLLLVIWLLQRLIGDLRMDLLISASR